MHCSIGARLLEYPPLATTGPWPTRYVTQAAKEGSLCANRSGSNRRGVIQVEVRLLPDFAALHRSGSCRTRESKPHDPAPERDKFGKPSRFSERSGSLAFLLRPRGLLATDDRPSRSRLRLAAAEGPAKTDRAWEGTRGT